MAIPDFQSIMLPLLELSGDGEIRHVGAAVDKLALGFSLTDAEMNELLPSGKKPRFRDRVSWAAHYLKKAGLLESPKRAHYRITDRGRSVLADSPPKIDVKFLDQFDEFVDSRTQRRKDPSRIDRSGVQPVIPPTNTPDEALQDAYQTLRSSLVAEVLDAVRKSPPTFFEKLVVDVLVRMGYGGSHQEAGQAIGKSGDEGIDGIIKEDRLGLDIIYIQAKRWESVVGRPEVQKFAGALQGQRARKGVFITTSTFSREATQYAAKIETKIILIGGEQLAELMFDHGVGVSTDATYAVKRIDADYFSDE
ncbi:MAG: restriction endonuclease [Spirochaetaceae bacterium]|nr:restriction endonuclease [Spirochaetaceae bacterium]